MKWKLKAVPLPLTFLRPRILLCFLLFSSPPFPSLLAQVQGSKLMTMKEHGLCGWPAGLGESRGVLHFFAFSSFTQCSFPAGIRIALFHKYAPALTAVTQTQLCPSFFFFFKFES